MAKTEEQFYQRLEKQLTNAVEKKIYRVSWDASEHSSYMENIVYHTFKEAKNRAREHHGWYGGNGTIYSQTIIIDKDTNKIIMINEPEYIDYHFY